MPAPKTPPHSVTEDVVAIIAGTLMISFSIALFKHTGILTGGTAGVAFLLHYAFDIDFGLAFFLLNLPFAYLSIKRMGWRFTVKTFISIGLISIFSELHSHLIVLGSINPFYISVIGGLIMGVGFIVLFRHETSLGGINILALYMQDRYRIRAGKFQMLVDVIIVLATMAVIDLTHLAASVCVAVIVNLLIAMNHKPGRYFGLASS